jgi:hypothetical protein
MKKADIVKQQKIDKKRALQLERQQILSLLIASRLPLQTVLKSDSMF